MLRISSISQYAGDEASAWFSTLLNVPGCKMYQIHEPRYGSEDKRWGEYALPGDKVLEPLEQGRGFSFGGPEDRCFKLKWY